VLYWLQKHGIPSSDEIVERIYARAKASDHTLSETEILECVERAAMNARPLLGGQTIK
jgi:hypothetical protein